MVLDWNLDMYHRVLAEEQEEVTSTLDEAKLTRVLDVAKIPPL